MGVQENRSARPEWGIDAMLIDEELLYLDDKDADRVYQELMEKSMRRRQMEARENRLSKQMSLDDQVLQNINNESDLPKKQALDFEMVMSRQKVDEKTK
jgi:hypothetical protein